MELAAGLASAFYLDISTSAYETIAGILLLALMAVFFAALIHNWRVIEFVKRALAESEGVRDV